MHLIKVKYTCLKKLMMRMLFPFYDRSVTSSHKTRKILIQLIKQSSQKSVGNHPLSLQRRPPKTEGRVSDSLDPRTRTVREKMVNSIVLKFRRLHIRFPRRSWVSSFYASLEDAQDFQKFHVFSHGCFLEFSAPAHVTNADMSVYEIKWCYNSPAWVNMEVPRPTWNSGSGVRTVTNTVKP